MVVFRIATRMIKAIRLPPPINPLESSSKALVEEGSPKSWRQRLGELLVLI